MNTPALTRSIAEKFAHKNFPEKYPPGVPISDGELLPFLTIGEFCVELLIELASNSFVQGWNDCATIWDWEEGVHRYFNDTPVHDEAQRRYELHLQSIKEIR